MELGTTLSNKTGGSSDTYKRKGHWPGRAILLSLCQQRSVKSKPWLFQRPWMDVSYKESWAQRIDAFELWCWRRLLRVSWTARRSNQFILKEISPECSLEVVTPMLWPPDAKSWLVWKDPDAGKDWRREEKGTTEDEMVGWHHWPNGHEFE